MTATELPEDWELVRLGDHFSITSSKRVFQRDWRSSGVPFYRARELAVLGEKGHVDNELFIDREMYDRYRRAYGAPEPGDFLVTGVGTLGKTYVVQDGDEFYFKDGNIIWFKAAATVDSSYLNQLYRTPVVLDQVFGNSGGSTVGTYTITNAKLTVVPLPPRDEQSAIARALRDADDLIATLERLIAKKQAIKQGMMQQLLTGRTRLPGFTDPWIETRLGSLGTCIRGVSYDPAQDLSFGDQAFTIRLLRSNNVQNGRIDRDGLQFVHERRVSSVQVLAPGDIVICMANGSRDLVGKAALFEPMRGESRYTFGAFMGAFRTNNSVADPKFVAESMGTQAFRVWLDLILSGSSINNLRPSDVEGFVASMPTLAEQVAISEVLADADAEIGALRVRLTKARAVKQGMMQQLLTGRTRLPVEAVV